VEEVVKNALIKANTAVLEAPRQGKGKYGMGTTASILFLLPSRPGKKQEAVIGHVGDSRIYQITVKGEIRQVTTDHGYAGYLGSATEEEIKKELVTRPKQVGARGLSQDAQNYAEKRNILIQAIGSRAIFPDVNRVSVQPDDIFVLLTDGGHDPLLINDVLPEIAAAARTQSPQAATALLMQKVRESRQAETMISKDDDTSVLVVRVQVVEAEPEPETLTMDANPEEIKNTAQTMDRYRALEKEIEKAQSFHELYIALESARSAKEKEILNPDEAADLVDSLRQADTLDAGRVPETAGLRAKVVALLESGAGIREANSLQQLKTGLRWAKDVASEEDKTTARGLSEVVINRKQPALARQLGGLHKDLEEVVIRLTLHESTDFEELYRMLRDLKTIRSKSREYAAEAVIAKIQAYRDRTARDDMPQRDTITNAYNLRELAQTLLLKERRSS